MGSTDKFESSLPEELMPGTLFDLKKAGIWITDIDIKNRHYRMSFLSFARREKK